MQHAWHTLLLVVTVTIIIYKFYDPSKDISQTSVQIPDKCMALVNSFKLSGT